MDRKLHIGIIGCGGIANGVHLSQLSKLEGVEIAALCDVNPKALAETGDKYGVPDRTEMKDYLYACYGEHVKEEANIPDGVLDVLHTLRSRGYKLAVCSSADRVKVLMNLSAIGAEQTLFDPLVTGTDIKNPKPDPEIYQTGAASLGLAPAECIVVEDAPSGIRAAHAAGIQAIGLATSFPAEYLREQAQPDYLLPDLKSILTML